MDTDLIDRAREGDAEALEKLLVELAPVVRRFGVRMCRHDADAEDVLQDTLLSVATHLKDYEGRASLSSWVFTLARSACARKRRGLKNQPHASADALASVGTEQPSPEAAAGDRELHGAVDHALGSLSEEHREVVLLRDMEGLTAPEVAEALGISVQAVKSRLHRARTALREALREALEGGSPERKPDCPDVLAALSRKLEGDLDSDDCATMEAHLAECPACASACSGLRQALGACRAQASEGISPAVREEIQQAVRGVLAGVR